MPRGVGTCSQLPWWGCCQITRLAGVSATAMEVIGGGGLLDESSRSWHWLPASSDCTHHEHIIMSSKPSQNAKENCFLHAVPADKARSQLPATIHCQRCIAMSEGTEEALLTIKIPMEAGTLMVPLAKSSASRLPKRRSCSSPW